MQQDNGCLSSLEYYHYVDLRRFDVCLTTYKYTLGRYIPCGKEW